MKRLTTVTLIASTLIVAPVLIAMEQREEGKGLRSKSVDFSDLRRPPINYDQQHIQAINDLKKDVETATVHVKELQNTIQLTTATLKTFFATQMKSIEGLCQDLAAFSELDEREFSELDGAIAIANQPQGAVGPANRPD